jgi:hypothetical protein
LIEGRISCLDRPQIILTRVRKTETLVERTKGLLGCKSLMQGEGLLISPCNSIHTFFMLFPIDVVFLNKKNMITKIIRTMKPFRFGMAFNSSSVLELMAGQADRSGMQPGDYLLWEKVV